MLKEKVRHKDLILYEVMRHPVLFAEFMDNIDNRPGDTKIELSEYQKEIACDFNSRVAINCGRAIGKSFILARILLWILVNRIFPKDYIVYSVPNKVHLKPVWDILVRMFRANSILKHFISRKEGVNASEFVIHLTNGTTLMCRIAGQAGTGGNVMGLHTPFFIVDEAGLYDWKTWIELQPTINTFEPGHRLMVSGVPIGLREKNVLYHVDQENQYFTKHRVTSLQNPRYSEADHQRDLEQYGGEDKDDYQRNVLGKHGTPTFAIFDRALMEISDYPTYKLVINGLEMRDDIGEYIRRLALVPSIDANTKMVIMGADLGYHESTVIKILYRTSSGQFKFHASIQLVKVGYPLQDKIIDYLDSKFAPSCIGVDAGGVGAAVVQALLMNDEYNKKNYEARLLPVDFNSNLSMGFNNDGEEVTSKTKDFVVTLLQEFTNSHRIVYTSTDYDMISELERMTYMRNPSGHMVYKTLTPGGGKLGADHATSALLCAVLAYYMLNERVQFGPKKKKLISPRWF